MKGFQKRYLRSLGHHLKPVVFIGKNGLTEAVADKIEHELDAHELIKLKFSDFKDQKKELLEQMASASHSEVAGLVGNTAILFRENSDPEKRQIRLPTREDD